MSDARGTPIFTRRLVLQPVTSDIALAVVNGHAGTIPAPPGWPHEDTPDAMAMAPLPDAGPSWLILHDDVVIGDCGAFSWPAAGGGVEVGYGLAEPCRGSGYGTEAAAAMCDWLFAEAGAAVITATGIDPGNVASRRVLEKIGFTQVSLDQCLGGEVELLAPASGGARNDVWFARVNGERCAVRQSSRDDDSLEWELDTIEAARSSGFGAPRVVYTVTGESCRAAWARIESYPCSLVHGDPNIDNIVITAEGVVLLDWDESRVDASLFDLAALPDEVSALDEVDRRITSQAASAWEAAVSWRHEPAYARRRLRELTS